VVGMFIVLVVLVVPIVLVVSIVVDEPVVGVVDEPVVWVGVGVGVVMLIIMLGDPGITTEWCT
jgi:hypothetical protein